VEVSRVPSTKSRDDSLPMQHPLEGLAFIAALDLAEDARVPLQQLTGISHHVEVARSPLRKRNAALLDFGVCSSRTCLDRELLPVSRVVELHSTSCRATTPTSMPYIVEAVQALSCRSIDNSFLVRQLPGRLVSFAVHRKSLVLQTLSPSIPELLIGGRNSTRAFKEKQTVHSKKD
jgi:hypothetical protein